MKERDHVCACRPDRPDRPDRPPLHRDEPNKRSACACVCARVHERCLPASVCASVHDSVQQRRRRPAFPLTICSRRPRPSPFCKRTRARAHTHKDACTLTYACLVHAPMHAHVTHLHGGYMRTSAYMSVQKHTTGDCVCVCVCVFGWCRYWLPLPKEEVKA